MTDYSKTRTGVFQYRGASMYGTFRPGDMLVVREVDFDAVCPGDVIAFRAPDSDTNNNLIVHRVLERTYKGLITQGDACHEPDDTCVQADDLLGRVIQVQRGTRTRAVQGGLIGRCWAYVTRFGRHMLALGRLPYRWLRASRVVRYLWRPIVTQVYVITSRGPVIKYLCGSSTIAVWQPATRTYWCQKPYDLVLDTPDNG